MMKMDEAAVENVVIVGGGICGLATALALHRKGVRCTVLERSESLRAIGATLTIRTNGWHALDHLGVGAILRQTTLPLQQLREIWVDKDKQKESQLSKGEVRCVKRSDLLIALASDLPDGTIRFGCRIQSVKIEPCSSYTILKLENGCSLKAKIVIGCDGVNSVVADSIGIQPAKLSSQCAIRGFTEYPSGHGLAYEFVNYYKGHILIGKVPVSPTLVYWFVTRQSSPREIDVSKDHESIKRSTIASAEGFPSEVIDMLKNCECTSLSLMPFKYRRPWDILQAKFRRETVTVAGDALHAMGPFIGQGGAASLEDAVILARCLAKALEDIGHTKWFTLKKNVEKAIDQYQRERKTRLVRLSLQSYLIGKLFEVPLPMKLLIIIFMIILFRDPIGHTKYNCGVI